MYLIDIIWLITYISRKTNLIGIDIILKGIEFFILDNFTFRHEHQSTPNQIFPCFKVLNGNDIYTILLRSWDNNSNLYLLVKLLLPFTLLHLVIMSICCHHMYTYYRTQNAFAIMSSNVNLALIKSTDLIRFHLKVISFRQYKMCSCT